MNTKETVAFVLLALGFIIIGVYFARFFKKSIYTLFWRLSFSATGVIITALAFLYLAYILCSVK